MERCRFLERRRTALPFSILPDDLEVCVKG
jgi:hypothetical protein